MLISLDEFKKLSDEQKFELLCKIANQCWKNDRQLALSIDELGRRLRLLELQTGLQAVA